MFGLTKTQTIVVGVVFLLGMIIFYFSAWKPGSIKIEQLQQEVRNREVKLAEARSVEKQLPYLEARYESLKREVEYAHTQLPESKEIAGLINTITETGNKCRVKISLFSPEPPIKQSYGGNKQYLVVPIKLNVRVDFHNLGMFLAQVGQLRRVINVKDLQISPRPVTPEEPEGVRADFTLVTYTF